MNQNSPRARKEKLIVKELPDETLIYDLDRDKAHCLNETAGLVWKECDGKRTIAELAMALEKKLGAPVDEDVIRLALDQLERFHLLEKEIPETTYALGISRRKLIRKITTAGVVSLPFVISILAPIPAQAASGAPGVCCNSPGDCISNNCSSSNPGPACPPPNKRC
jgi:coenzyme PQQ synthesis protein D (PqqD)